MTLEQSLIFALLGGAMIMFIWGKFRYDLIAFGTLCACMALTLVPGVTLIDFEHVFEGFGHPAVITVAMVLVLSRALQLSGAMDRVSAPIASLSDRPTLFLAAVCGLGAFLSAFMNNVGALALLMPLVIQTAKHPAQFLMPLSFGTILGGLATQIGTPPNIYIASYRRDLMEAKGLENPEMFAMFDFAPVGLAAAVLGVAFVITIGWRLLPLRDDGGSDHANLFKVKNYITEFTMVEESPVIGKQVRELEDIFGESLIVIGLIRGSRTLLGNVRHRIIRADDIIIVRGSPDELGGVLTDNGLVIAGSQDFVEEHLQNNEVTVLEAVVSPNSRVEGRSPKRLFLRRLHQINLLGIAREGRPFVERIAHVSLRAGDVVLLQGEKQNLANAVQTLGLLPLADRNLEFLGAKSKVDWLPLILFLGAIAVTAFKLMPIHVSYSLALVAMVLAKSIPLDEVYDAIDWPVLVLIGCMLPIGAALEATGATQLIANGVSSLAGGYGPIVLLTLIFVVTMTLSDLMNNVATAVVMAPIAVQVADKQGLNPDAFLMAVAISASCAFLTPIGHKNNLLVMGPGGYRFGDYWRMGLPLELVIIAVSIPLIIFVWGLYP